MTITRETDFAKVQSETILQTNYIQYTSKCVHESTTFEDFSISSPRSQISAKTTETRKREDLLWLQVQLSEKSVNPRAVYNFLELQNLKFVGADHDLLGRFFNFMLKVSTIKAKIYGR